MPANSRTRTDGWQASSACRNEDPDLFFPGGESGAWLLQIEEAKSFCRRCPVLEDCIRYAYDTRPTDGIFGGLTANERNNLLRRAARRRAKHAKATG